jgi:cell wall assembly regulator SMI1
VTADAREEQAQARARSGKNGRMSKTSAGKVAKSATRKAAKSGTKSVTKRVAKSAAKKVAKSVTKSGTKSATRKEAKSATKVAKSATGAGKQVRAHGDLAARATAAAGRLVAWLRAHAQLEPPPAGASAAALAAVERQIGSPLPPDLAAWWRLHDGGVPIFEYAGFGTAMALLRRDGLEKLRRAGTFKKHELFEQSVPRIAAVKWHPGWVPIAEDGCGNLWLVDTAPGPAGKFGQVLRWEVAGGAFASSSSSLAEVLERYADALASGRFKYEPDSGTFDGPFLDLLESEG